ncbi:MAG: acyl-CoA thioesterase domain-containing protein [Alphaproteobacteria bacterium]
MATVPTPSGLISAAAPLLRRAGDTWIACAEASGPFTGLQGGAIAAILAAEIERVAPNDARPVSLRVEFLRRVPLESELHVEVAALQRGRRVAVFEASVLSGGRRCARAQMTLAAPAPNYRLTEPFESHPRTAPFADPETGIGRKPRAPHGGPWLMDSLDGRISGDGVFWFRWNRPLLPPEFQSPFTSLLPPADWAHGIARPGFPGPPPASAWPNLDLTVHTVRMPTGAWIGLRPEGHWTTDGLAIGGGELVDQAGAFGRVAMGVAVFA